MPLEACRRRERDKVDDPPSVGLLQPGEAVEVVGDRVGGERASMAGIVGDLSLLPPTPVTHDGYRRTPHQPSKGKEVR